MEQFEQLVYPEVAALAVTDEELAHIEQLIAVYIGKHRDAWGPDNPDPTQAEEEAACQAYLRFIEAIFAATHNVVLTLLAKPLIQLHSTRNWDPGEAVDDVPYEELLALEQETLAAMLAAVASRDPQHARQVMKELLTLPAEAEAAMRRTPVGETPVIPLPFRRWRNQ